MLSAGPVENMSMGWVYSSMQRWGAIGTVFITIVLAFAFGQSNDTFFFRWELLLFSWGLWVLLVELGWVCLSFFSHASSSRCFHWALGSDNHFVISQLWWWCWLVHIKIEFQFSFHKRNALCQLWFKYFVESAFNFWVMIWYDLSFWCCRNNDNIFSS